MACRSQPRNPADLPQVLASPVRVKAGTDGRPVVVRYALLLSRPQDASLHCHAERRLVLRALAARSVNSATAAPRTGGRALSASQQGGLFRPAPSGGSTPSRRYNSA